MPLQHTITFVNLRDENQPEKINPQSLLPPAIHLPDVKDSKRWMNSLFDVSNLAIENFPSAVFAVHMQSLGTCFTVYPSTLIPPSVTSPCQSSPLGPSQHLLHGWPVFPPSACKPDLYCQALKKSKGFRREANVCIEGKIMADNSGGVKSHSQWTNNPFMWPRNVTPADFWMIQRGNTRPFVHTIIFFTLC